MRDTVLVVTHSVDDHAPLVRRELERLGADVVWLDTDRYRDSVDLDFSVEGGVPITRLRIDGSERRGDRIAAVLFRQIRLPIAPDVEDPAARRLAESELRATLEGALLALEPALWINHPHANRLVRSKLLQLRCASRLGFQVPDTRVTADPQEIRRLYQRWNGQMIAKLAGGQLAGETIDSQYIIHTSLVAPEDLEDDAGLSACPAIYQRRVDKRYELRVTMVGDEAFACRIASEKLGPAQVDWRELGSKKLDLQPCVLEASVADKCRALMRTFGLEIAGIDLVVTPENDVVFLEINATGQWVFVQETTGLPIAGAIARRLASAIQVPSKLATA